MKTLELAQIQNLAKYVDIIDQGRKFQQAQGFVQWTEDYPNEETLKGDIEIGRGYALMVDGEIAGYMCIDFDGEPAYDNIDGSWRRDDRYAVVHRMAFDGAFVGMGFADAAFKLIEEFCEAKEVFYIRVDTDFPNKRMQHILAKNGYVHCGVIEYQGGDRLAYDKILEK